jgi:hypothetical protein
VRSNVSPEPSAEATRTRIAASAATHSERRNLLATIRQPCRREKPARGDCNRTDPSYLYPLDPREREPHGVVRQRLLPYSVFRSLPGRRGPVTLAASGSAGRGSRNSSIASTNPGPPAKLALRPVRGWSTSPRRALAASGSAATHTRRTNVSIHATVSRPSLGGLKAAFRDCTRSGRRYGAPRMPT